MKLVKTAAGKTVIQMTQKEWVAIGHRQGWLKSADAPLASPVQQKANEVLKAFFDLHNMILKDQKTAPLANKAEGVMQTLSDLVQSLGQAAGGPVPQHAPANNEMF